METGLIKDDYFGEVVYNSRNNNRQIDYEIFRGKKISVVVEGSYEPWSILKPVVRDVVRRVQREYGDLAKRAVNGINGNQYVQTGNVAAYSTVSLEKIVVYADGYAQIILNIENKMVRINMLRNGNIDNIYVDM